MFLIKLLWLQTCMSYVRAKLFFIYVRYLVTKNPTAFERIGGHSLMPRVVQKKKGGRKILKKKKERQGQVINR